MDGTLGSQRAAFLLMIGLLALLGWSGLGQASHVPGATYSGTHEAGGTQPGGTLEFTVSADGTRITGIKLPDLVCLLRGTIPASDVFGDIDIARSSAIHQFKKTVSGGSFSGSFFEGSFHDPRSAAGTLDISLKSTSFTCEMPTLRWTAAVSRVSAPPPPPAVTTTVRCVVPNVRGKTLAAAKASREPTAAPARSPLRSR